MADALPRVVIDFETRSVLDVRKTGAWRYAQHPSTEILCMSYRVGNAQTGLWTPDLPFPQELIDHVEAGGEFEAHNAQFEFAIWLFVLSKGRHGGPPVPLPKRWRCTLALCAHRALPIALDDVGDALPLETKKNPRGKYLLQQLSKPRKPRKAEREAFVEQGLEDPDDWPTLWREDWDLIEELYDYCIQDTDTECGVSDMLGELPPPEQRIWVLDQKINRRGVQIDVEAVHACHKVVALIKEELNAEIATITDGAVSAGSEVAKIKDWLNEQGLALDDLTKDTIKHARRRLKIMVERGTPWEEVRHVDRVLAIRQQTSRSSTSKLDTFLRWVMDDGRVRGMLQYHGASTGRWAGRGPQPQNFPRGSLEDYAKKLGLPEPEAMELLIATIKVAAEMSDPLFIEETFGDPMEALATALRGLFVAAEGKVLRVSDFTAIEAVVLAWLAGEEWKLEAFRAAQRGEGPEIYCVAAEAVFGFPVNKKDNPKERSIGKVLELASGYQGWIGAWRNFDSREPDEEGYLQDEEIAEYMGAWRNKHPATTAQWRALNDMAIRALKTGKPCGAPNLYYEVVYDNAGKWLTCVLPNGRRLWYYNPELRTQYREGRGSEECVTFEGKDNKRQGKWGRIYGYGGLWTENIVQAICRDLMVEAMIRTEKAGYATILTVHDEIVAETDEDFGSQEEFESLMAELPKWMQNCPVAVDGWCGTRYMKA